MRALEGRIRISSKKPSSLTKVLLHTIIPQLLLDDKGDDSAKMLRHLELIDDDLSLYGVKVVKIEDPIISKKYGMRQPPGIGLFRKGTDFIKYEGDIFDQDEMLEWLTDPNVMAVNDQIERVNRKMLNKLLKRNEYMAVLFCK